MITRAMEMFIDYIIIRAHSRMSVANKESDDVAQARKTIV